MSALAQISVTVGLLFDESEVCMWKCGHVSISMTTSHKWKTDMVMPHLVSDPGH
jgi:hypothetical protein